MKADRRDFIKAVSVLAATGTVEHSVSAQGAASVEVAGQPPGRLGDIEAFAFDAYGTLFDVFSVTALCEELFPGHGNELARLWRAKQLQYSLLRSLMGRHRDFWLVTEDALVYASKSLRLDLTETERDRLMRAYLTLAVFPDVKPGLEALKRQGLRLAILSNGEPRMLEAAAKSAGIDALLDTIVSVEEIKIFKVSPRVYKPWAEAALNQRDHDGLRVVQLVGYQWGRIRGADHLLDPKKYGRATRGTRLCGEPCGQRAHRPCADGAGLRLSLAPSGASMSSMV